MSDHPGTAVRTVCQQLAKLWAVVWRVLGNTFGPVERPDDPAWRKLAQRIWP